MHLELVMVIFVLQVRLSFPALAMKENEIEICEENLDIVYIFFVFFKYFLFFGCIVPAIAKNEQPLKSFDIL